MKEPNFSEEKKLWRKGYRVVVGFDEAGRGPLAGPVVAAAVCFKRNSNSKVLGLISGLNDSKKLTAKQREYFFNVLTKNCEVRWGIGRVSEKIIDKINILEATKLAMQKAVTALEKKEKTGPADFLLLDGNFKINSVISQKSVIKGDEKVFSCAAASVLAKVTRDRIMLKYHKKYSQYGFGRHKGYPTAFHLKALEEFGPCKIHRKTFGPVLDKL